MLIQVWLKYLSLLDNWLSKLPMTVKTDDLTSITKNMVPHEQFRAFQE